MGKARGKGRKLGRNASKCLRYKNAKTREKNKLKRILQSSGYDAAVKYAKDNLLHIPSKPTIKENLKRTK